MYELATLLTLVNQVSGTPYITGGDSPAGTDCSGLVSWVTNAATGRPVFGDRFNTGNIEGALKARGFKFVGPVIVHAWLQATGVIDDHEPQCFRRRGE